jgi:hypothetical protein
MAFLPPDATEEMTDEELQQLMALGIIPDQQGALEKQMALAEQLRYRNNPEMRGNGRVQTAAHPLEFLASGIQGYKAGKQIEELRKKQDELLQQQVSGRKLFYQNLRKRPSQPGLGDMPELEEYL